MARLPANTRVPDDFYDAEYFLLGVKSSYRPYGPGDWIGWLAGMVIDMKPSSVLDVGCAYGYVVRALREKGVTADGFDVSDYACAHKVVPGIKRGDAADPAAYPQSVDLVIATELVTSLTTDQSLAFLANVARVASRLLILAHYSPTDGGDWSHINFLPVQWWLDEAAKVGLHLAEPATTNLNADERSVNMGWAGRFLYFEKKGEDAGDRDPDGEAAPDRAPRSVAHPRHAPADAGDDRVERNDAEPAADRAAIRG